MSESQAPAEKKPAKAKGPEMVWVVAVNADMLNLHTNVWYSKDPKKVELDEFVAGQVAAGKLELVQP